MDEYGSFEGVVTAADVLEAIIGDLAEPGYGTPSQAADQMRRRDDDGWHDARR